MGTSVVIGSSPDTLATTLSSEIPQDRIILVGAHAIDWALDGTLARFGGAEGGGNNLPDMLNRIREQTSV